MLFTLVFFKILQPFVVQRTSSSIFLSSSPCLFGVVGTTAKLPVQFRLFVQFDHFSSALLLLGTILACRRIGHRAIQPNFFIFLAFVLGGVFAPAKDTPVGIKHHAVLGQEHFFRLGFGVPLSFDLWVDGGFATLDNDDDRGEQQEENNCEKSGWHGTKQRLSGVPLGCFTGEAVPGSEQPREEFFGET